MKRFMREGVFLFMVATALTLTIAGAGCSKKQSGPPPVPFTVTSSTILDDAQAAQNVLVDFFDNLASKKYGPAAALYGGDWSTILIYSDTKNSDAHSLQKYCDATQTCLKIKQVLASGQVGDYEYVYTVQFAKPDGSLFTYGPFNGETPGPGNQPETDFDFKVQKIGGKWKVTTPPLYVP